jgi:hypothetical protein
VAELREALSLLKGVVVKERVKAESREREREKIYCVKDLEWSFWKEREEKRLLELRVIEARDNEGQEGCGVYHPAFFVPKKDLFRLVVDLTRRNKEEDSVNLVYDNLRELLPGLMKVSHAFVWDVKDAFYVVPLACSARQHFQFTVGTKKEVRRYRLRCLPMGWCLSPSILTKVLGPVKRHIASWSEVEAEMLYLDDGFCGCQTEALCVEARDKVVELARLLGLTLKELPRVTSRPTYVGVDLNLELKRVELPRAKIKKIKKRVTHFVATTLRGGRRIRTTELASMVGQLQAATLALPVGRLHLRALYGDMNREGPWSKVSKEALWELRWWQQMDRSPKYRDFVRRAGTRQLWVDASGYALGAVLGKKIFSRQLTRTEKQETIGVKEAWALQEGLEAFQADFLPGDCIEVLGDNASVVYSANKLYSRNLEMHRAIQRTEEWASRRKVAWFMTWVPTTTNLADAPSRRTPAETYQFSHFEEVTRAWGVTPTIDRFATRADRLCQRYNCAFNEQWSEGSAWDHNWGANQEENWWNPPFSLLGRVLMKILAEGAGGILVMPEWRSRSWFQLVAGLPVTKWKRYPGKTVVYKDAAGEEMPGPSWATLVLRISPR